MPACAFSRRRSSHSHEARGPRGKCGECEHAGAGTTLAHAEISAYMRVILHPVAVSRDEFLTQAAFEWDLPALHPAPRPPCPRRLARHPPCGPSASVGGQPVPRRTARARGCSADGADARPPRSTPPPRTNRMIDIHTPHRRPEHVVELDGVDPEALDPAASGGVDHHVDREHAPEAELEATVEVDQQRDARRGSTGPRRGTSGGTWSRSGSSARSASARGRSPAPTAAWSGGRRAPG